MKNICFQTVFAVHNVQEKWFFLAFFSTDECGSVFGSMCNSGRTYVPRRRFLSFCQASCTLLRFGTGVPQNPKLGQISTYWTWTPVKKSRYAFLLPMCLSASLHKKVKKNCWPEIDVMRYEYVLRNDWHFDLDFRPWELIMTVAHVSVLP